MISYKNFWKKFYRIKKPPVFNSQFSNFCLRYFKNYKGVIFDLGCGNGRDTIFFRKNRLNCYGLDQIGIIIKKNKKKYQKHKKFFIKKNFSNTNFDSISKERFSIYSRFSLHSISLKQEKKFINNLIKSKKLDFIMIETRTVYDELYGVGKKISKLEYFTDHYRRFIEPLKFKTKLKKNFKIKFFKVSKNFAKFKRENPKVLRIIAKNER